MSKLQGSLNEILIYYRCCSMLSDLVMSRDCYYCLGELFTVETQWVECAHIDSCRFYGIWRKIKWEYEKDVLCVSTYSTYKVPCHFSSIFVVIKYNYFSLDNLLRLVNLSSDVQVYSVVSLWVLIFPLKIWAIMICIFWFTFFYFGQITRYKLHN